MSSMERLSRSTAPFVVAAILTSSICGIAASACPCSQIPKPEAKGPDYDRAEGIAFTRTAQYRKQFSDAIAAARKAILEHQGDGGRLAVVSDIDETLLDNRLEFERHPEFKWSEFAAWINEAKAPTLKPTADFLRFARQHGYAIFLITGRPEHERAGTIQNLVRRGIAYDGLFMRSNNNPSGVAEVMKSAYRKQIEDMGFKVIVNIGDQYSDLYGGHSVDCEKLPNKMYYIP